MKNRSIFILLFLSIILLSGLAVLDYYLHDFHTVIPNQVYRSRELSTKQFNQVIHAYGIKSILNLRGANPGSQWYKDEMAVAAQNQIQHYDLALSSYNFPSKAAIIKLVSILQSAPRPILIHCESGVDRSGFAATISLILMDAPMSEIEKQESWKYFVFSNQSIGKQFLANYKKWLAENQLTTSKQNYLRWLAQYRN